MLEQDQKRTKTFTPSRYIVRSQTKELLSIFAEKETQETLNNGSGGNNSLDSCVLGRVAMRGECVIKHGPELDEYIRNHSAKSNEKATTLNVSILDEMYENFCL